MHRYTCTHWIALFCKRNEIAYLDRFVVEHVPEEIKEFAMNKNIKPSIFWVQAKSSIMCGYFCIGFIDFMFAGKKTGWVYKFVSTLWLWEKWQYNFKLF